MDALEPVHWGDDEFPEGYMPGTDWEFDPYEEAGDIFYGPRRYELEEVRT